MVCQSPDEKVVEQRARRGPRLVPLMGAAANGARSEAHGHTVPGVVKAALVVTVAAVVALMLLPTASAAEPTNKTEILYLLGFVERSGCQFYRNGSWYNSKKAQEHLRDKCNFLAAKGQINTAEDFIEKVATTSSVTNQPYMVRCSDGVVVSTNRWLRDELVQRRAGAAPR